MQRTIVSLIDDLDGSEATQTVTFALDGAEYEIDLSEENAGILAERLGAFIEHARMRARSRQPRKSYGRGRGKAAAASPPATPRRTDTDRSRSASVRAFAATHGIPCNAKGRIPMAVSAAYDGGEGSEAFKAVAPQATRAEEAPKVPKARAKRATGNKTPAKAAKPG